MERVPKKVKCTESQTTAYIKEEIYDVDQDYGSVTNSCGHNQKYFTKWDNEEPGRSKFEPIWEDEFVLPEKWYLKPNNITEAQKLRDWWVYTMKKSTETYTKDAVLTHGLSVPDYGYCHEPSHTKITFDQFKKHVLKEDDESKEYLTKDDLVEGEVYLLSWYGQGKEYITYFKNTEGNPRIQNQKYYRETNFNDGVYYYKPATKQQKEHLEQCIAAGEYVEYKKEVKLSNWWDKYDEGDSLYVVSETENDCFELHNVFKGEKYCSDRFETYVDSEGDENSWMFKYFREATKDEIKLYEHAGGPVNVNTYKIPKEVEKWSKGSWVVKVEDDGYCLEIGDIRTITSPLEHKTTFIEHYLSYDTELKTFKWFATKEEAEEFAETLKEPREDVPVFKEMHSVTIGKTVLGIDLESGTTGELFLDGTPSYKEWIDRSKQSKTVKVPLLKVKPLF